MMVDKKSKAQVGKRKGCGVQVG